MAGTTGAGGLGALGWSAVAAGAAALGGVVLYVAGVFDPAVEPVDEMPLVEEVAVLPEPESEPEPAPEAVPVTEPTQVEEQQPEAEPEIAVVSEESETEVAKPGAADDTVQQTDVASASEQDAVQEDEPSSETAAEPSDAEAEGDADVVAETQAEDSSAEGTAVPGQDSASVADKTEAEPSNIEDQPTEQPADIVGDDTPVVTEAPVEDQTPVLLAPSFDVVRVEPDGTTLIAGSGTEGSTVTVLLDGTRIDEFDILPGGQFVSFLDIGISTVPRVLTMRAVLGEASALSADSIIIAPAPQPVATDDEVAPADDVAALDDTTPEAPAQTPASEPQDSATEVEPDQAPVSQDTPQPVAAEDVPDADPEISQEAQAPIPAETSETGTGGSSTAGQEDVADSSVEAESPASEPAEPQPVAVIRAGEDGIEVIQSGAASEPSEKIEVSLDAIVYSEAGDVQLSGKANPGARVRVYLSNRAIIDALVGEDGRWSTELPGVEPGIYTLRLDEVDENGSVLSRLETPFKREAPEVLRPAPEPDPDPDPSPEPVAEAETPQEESSGPIVRVVTVQKGDTLWAISESRYGDGVQYVRLFEANRASIRDPDLIYPGQVFEIPE